MFDFSIVVFVWYFKGERPPLKLHKSIRERKMKPARGPQTVHMYMWRTRTFRGRGSTFGFISCGHMGRAHRKLFFLRWQQLEDDWTSIVPHTPNREANQKASSTVVQCCSKHFGCCTLIKAKIRAWSIFHSITSLTLPHTNIPHQMPT